MDKQYLLDFFYKKFLDGGRPKNQKIPKKIHQIWLGDLPEKVKNLSDRIKNNHPDWEYKLWTYEDVESFEMKNKKLFYSLSNRGAQSDVLRYEILNIFGGIYLDSDFYMVNNFDNLIDLDFFSGNGADGPEVFNGLFGCAPQHPILCEIIETLHNLSSDSVRTINDIMEKTGPYLFADKVFNFLNLNMDSNTVVLPKCYFYSFPAVDRFSLRINNYSENDILKNINEKTVCVHLWENSWQ
jgi:mannosyltransferase OCH1-like enzyme